MLHLNSQIYRKPAPHAVGAQEENMRLDKYLKVSRIIKRRTVANDACDADHVTVNGRRAKASYDVKEGADTGYCPRNG